MPNLFPYTNTHELNLDWILRVVKDFQTKYTNFDQALADALAAIESGKVEALDEISTDLTAAINDIEASQTAALTAIGNSKNSALADIATALSDATSAINSLNNHVQGQINYLRNQATSAISTAQTTALSNINTAKETAVSAVTASMNHATTIIEQLYNTLPLSAQDIISRLDLLDSIITGNTMESFTWLQGDYVYPEGTTPPTPPAIYTESANYNYLVSSRYMTGVGGRRLRVTTDGTIVMQHLLNWRNTPPGGSPGAYVPGQDDYFTSTYLDLLIPLDVTAISLTLAKPGLTDTLSPTDIPGHIEIQWITDFIGQRVLAPIETSLTANVARLRDELFFYESELYKALDDIDVGDTIVLEGLSANAVKTTVGYEEYLLSKRLENIEITIGPNSVSPYLLRVSGGQKDGEEKKKFRPLERVTIIGGTVAWNQLIDANTASVTLISGHRYVSYIGGVWSFGTSDGTAISVTGGTDQVFDLSLMFGTTIADYISTLETATPGAGVAWFRALFPKDYYAYDAGTLRSVKTSAHKMVGFNAYNIETGKALVIGGSEYEITGTYTTLTLNGESITPVSGKFTPAKSGELTVTGGDSTTCIHLRLDGERDGDYATYIESTYELDNTLELKGVPQLDTNNHLYYDGDEYESNGTVTRKYVTRVFNGSEEWGNNIVSGDTNYFYIKLGAINSVRETICIFNLYPQVRITSSNKLVGANVLNTSARNGAYLYVRPDNVTNMTIPQFKALLSANPLTVVYGITTPTAETATPYKNPQYVDDYGTEEFIDNRAVPIPVGNDTFYQCPWIIEYKKERTH